MPAGTLHESILLGHALGWGQPSPAASTSPVAPWLVTGAGQDRPQALPVGAAPSDSFLPLLVLRLAADSPPAPLPHGGDGTEPCRLGYIPWCENRTQHSQQLLSSSAVVPCGKDGTGQRGAIQAPRVPALALALAPSPRAGGWGGGGTGLRSCCPSCSHASCFLTTFERFL